jgi:prepilin-type N-terminal cleavage/methylation domain-containing protein
MIMKGKQWLLKSVNDQKRYGFTIPEVIAVIAITGVLAAITAPSLKIFGQRSPTDASNQLSAVFRRTRAKAISQTSAYRIKVSVMNYSPPVRE